MLRKCAPSSMPSPPQLRSATSKSPAASTRLTSSRKASRQLLFSRAPPMPWPKLIGGLTNLNWRIELGSTRSAMSCQIAVLPFASCD